MTTPPIDLEAQFGPIDIYLFDQLLRGRILPGMRILDAGCGHGRNLVYLLRGGYEVMAADTDPASVASVRQLAARLAPRLPPENFRVEPVDALSFPDASMDVVVCIAVLHFARDPAHWDAMVTETWRVLKPGGLYLARLATTIGIADRVRRLEGNRYLLPDGSERYLVNAAALVETTHRLGGTLADPLKTTLVQDQRAMTTWVMRKASSA